MSSRQLKWILFVAVPVVIAVYALYPPVPVAIQKRQVEKRAARTPEEAERHSVQVGQQYVVSDKVTWKRFLPLAFGQTESVTRLVERKADGTVVEEQTTSVRGRIKLGLDLAGGTELLYQLRPAEGETLTGKLAGSIDVLKKRIDPTNVKEYRIQAVEQTRILIQVPRATASEVEQLKSRLAKMGKLEFKVAVPQQSGDQRFRALYEEADKGHIPEGYVKMYLQGNPAQPTYFLVKKGPAEITGQELNPAKLAPTTDNNLRPAVGFQFNAVGSIKFAKITEAHVGWGLAIILDGVLKSAPVIQTRISGPGEITGHFTQQEVNDMISILRAGSLPMDIQLMQETTVGPQLGRDSIRQSLSALVFAAALVFAFMAVYYMWCGAVADGALLMNVVLLMGALSVLGAAVTLPGMAGIALTIGMAVDANILIYERIREESAMGKGVRLALKNGHDRAFTVIFDAQMTTILTAVILYLVGTGPVRGFAVTLTIGLLLSLFTAVVVTRLALETLVENERIREFRMLKLLTQQKIGFARVRKYCYIGSSSLAILGMIVFFSRGQSLFDIDFTGGTLVQLALAKPTPMSDVRERLAKGGFPDAEVQGVQAAALSGELTDFGVRIRGSGVNVEAVMQSVAQKLTAAGLLKEGDTLEATRDRTALSLQLSQPAAEMDLRKALAAGGDLYSLPGIATIVAPDTVRARRVLVYLLNPPGAGQETATWDRVLSALGWAGLERTDYKIVKSELKAESPAAGPAELDLSLDKPMSATLLETELAKRQFPQIRATATGTAGTDFTLQGDRQTLQQFANELPAGTDLRGVPAVDIQARSVTATLSEPFSEQDLRALVEQRGVTDMAIIPLDAPSDAFRLNLSYSAIREKMQAIFADLSRRANAVTFEPVSAGAAPVEEGRTLVTMKLGTSMSFADFKHYVSAADLGAEGAGIIAGEADYSPDMLVSDVTLRLPTAKAAEMETKIEQTFSVTGPVQKVATIGPTVAEELQGRALLAVLLSCVMIIFYLGLRFHAFRFGVGAVIALVHDVCITAGFIAFADWTGVFGNLKIGLPGLAAFLTIIGYSVNDTIVVFDRIRENMALQGKKVLTADLLDASVNQTLSRTILTSLTVLFTVLVIYLRGGPVLQGFALTLVIGVITGTYSSVYIASPIVLDWAYVTKGTRFFFKVLFFPFTLPFRLFAKKR